ncbi:MAG: hypothetical protein V1731_01405, partial [Candidatus Aenigmatarchaeota archaeon]
MNYLERRMAFILADHARRDLEWMNQPVDRINSYRQTSLSYYARTNVLNDIIANPRNYVNDFVQSFFNKETKSDRAIRIALGLEDGKQRSFAQVWREYGIHENPERTRKAAAYLGKHAFHEFVDNLAGEFAKYDNIYGQAKIEKIDYDGLFPTKLLNAFRRSGVRSLREMSGFTEEKLYSLRQIGENSLLDVNRVLEEHGYKPLRKEKEDEKRKWFSDDRINKLDLTGAEKKVLRSLGVSSPSKLLNMLELNEKHPDLYKTHYPVSNDMTARLKTVRNELLRGGIQMSMNLA